MTVYYVDDGGSGTSPFDTWAKAATNVKALCAAVTLASGDIVYLGHNTTCDATSSWSVVGPGASPPAVFISATQGSDPPAYQAGAKIGSSSGNAVTLDGALAFYGVTNDKNGSYSYINHATPDSNELCLLNNVQINLAARGRYAFKGGRTIAKNLTIDLTADGTTTRSESVFGYTTYEGHFQCQGLSFVNAGYRTGSVLAAHNENEISGADFSGFTNETTCELLQLVPTEYCSQLLTNCKTAATWVPFTSDRPAASHKATLINVGPSDSPTSLIERTFHADLVSSTSIYRTGGAKPEDIETAWLITTESTCSEGGPYYAPWLYGTIDATGSKTFTAHITNDTADLTDAEAWLEVEYLGTSDSPLSTLASDQRASPTATAAAQTDDTTSTWNGTGPSFAYKQKLAVTATVGEAGQYRARVVVGKASIASSAYLYVDPKVVVS
jgi:hypothetical protein